MLMFPFFPALLLLALHGHLGLSLEGQPALWPAGALEATGWEANNRQSPRLDVAALKLVVSVWEGIFKDSSANAAAPVEREAGCSSTPHATPRSGHGQSGRTRDGP